MPMKKWLLLLAIYLGGAIGVWLTQTWVGFTEFPFRELGALLWPLFPVAIKVAGRDRL